MKIVDEARDLLGVRAYWEHMASGATLTKQREFDEALVAFNAAIALDPLNPYGFAERAALRKQQGQVEKALQDYDTALRLPPEDPLIYSARAWILATSPLAQHRNGQQAIADATKACQLTNDRSPSGLESLAAACAEAGDFEQAIQCEEKALRMTAHFNLGNREARLKLFREGKPFHEPPSEDQR